MEMNSVCYFRPEHPDAARLLADHLCQSFQTLPAFYKSPIVLCIGSDKVAGDSLGPIVGSTLKKRYQKSISVYGTLEMPVHALNLDNTLANIRSQKPGHALLAIDASFGSRDHLGCITAGVGSILPGAGVNKELPEVGDIFVTGIVAAFTPFSHLMLQAARLSEIYALADTIAAGVAMAII